MAKKPASNVIPHPARTTSQPPDPPRKLGPAGMALWCRVLTGWRMTDVAETEVLCAACEILDAAEALASAISREGLTFEGPGGVRLHPGVRQETACRELSARLLARLLREDKPKKRVGRPSPGFGWQPPGVGDNA